MTLEEFFKKKRIDLPALEKANAALFSEFKNHFGQMGEKSFEHSKKYWFNKLRHQFPVPVEVKTEKVTTANPIAQQTIAESLTQEVVTPSAPPAPKLGFAPKFRAGVTPKPAAETDRTNEGNAASKPEGNTPELHAENPASKAAYVPKFKMKPKVETAVIQPEIEPEAPAVENIIPEQPPVNPAPKAAYVPKFKMKPKPETEISSPTAETAPAESENINPAQPAEVKPESEEHAPAGDNIPAKPAYKPRFNMKNMPPKNEG